jgi:predicted nucleic acid-binding protein
MLIVDASVWIDALHGTANRHTIWLRHAIRRQSVGLTTLTFCEVLQGVRSDAKFRGFSEDLQQFPILNACDQKVAFAAAQNYRTLRSLGITVRKSIDCVIATFCIERGHHLLHNDRDYDGFETHLGLRVVDPPTISLN